MGRRAISLSMAVAVVVTLEGAVRCLLAQSKEAPPKVTFVMPPLSEHMEIDGAKNPEMIAQWDAWQRVLLMLEGSTDYPTVLYRGMTKEELSTLRNTASSAEKIWRDCEARVLKLADILNTPEARYVNERTFEIKLDCRNQILQLSDALAQDLSPAGFAAISQFVESTKKGMRVFVMKDELAKYRQPR